MSETTVIAKLENYTLQHPQEVLLVHAHIEGEPDQIVVFRGFSSSLMRSTAFDPEIPILPASAIISQIDRLKSPYQPHSPQYLERGILLNDFVSRV